MSDTPLLSQIMESDDESDYLRPDSTDEGSVLSSQYGDYVDPDTFIPPDHIQSAVVSKGRRPVLTLWCKRQCVM